MLGSVQAVAQPEIEDAYVVLSPPADAEPNKVYVVMSEAVYGNGAVELLPGDFMATAVNATGTDLATTGAAAAIRIDGLQNSRLTADRTFTLVFAPAVRVAGRRLTYAGAALAADGFARSIENELGEPFEALTGFTGSYAIRSHPTQERELTLTLELDDRMVLEMARARGQKYVPFERFADPGDATTAAEQPAIQLPEAVGPPGEDIRYLLTSSRLDITTLAEADTRQMEAPEGLHFESGSEVRALYGTMPVINGDYDLTYTAFLGADFANATATSSVTFTLKVGEVPEAPTNVTVETASNSSLLVSWSKPNDNNDPITHYELGYKLEHQDDQRPTWTTMPARTDRAVPTSHTLAGLDPGTYEVRVRAVNSIATNRSLELKKTPLGAWSSPIAKGSTGTGPEKPTLTFTVNTPLPEGRDNIPVTVTATVNPSAEPVRVLEVQLKLLQQLPSKVETNAEFSTKTVPVANPDVSWASADTDPVLSKAVEFRFTSNLSSEQTIYLKTGEDVDAEDENFRITATSAEVPNIFSEVKSADTTKVVVDDDEVQVYELGLPYQVEASMELMEGYGGSTLPVNLVVTPARTVATNYIVSLTSQEDASDYSLLSPSSGSPSSIGTRVSLMEDSMGEQLTLTAVQNDGDRVDDTITLQLFKADAAGVKGDQLGDDIVLTVLDRHMLPTVTRGAIMVEDTAVTSLAEGEMGTVELLVDRGTTTDNVPDNESIKVMLSLAPTSEAGADDFRLGSAEVSVGTAKMATFELEALVDDADVDDEMLVLQAEVTGSATNGPGATVDLAAITITDGTMKLVWAKTQTEVETAVYDAKMDGMGDDEMFTPGEMIEVMGSALFNAAEGVTLTYSAESSDAAVASTMSGDGTVTVTAMGEGDAMVTITAHASMPSGVKINDQTDPREASITFPVEVGLEALSFMLSGPDDMNIVEGGMAHANGTMGAAMLTVTASRAVAMDTEVMIMRERSMSTAMDSDYMPVPTMITIEMGEMMGSVEITATEDDMAEDMEELVLYGMVGDMMVEGQVKLYIWDAAVPALPIIAQLLLAAFLAIGGYRRYLRR